MGRLAQHGEAGRVAVEHRVHQDGDAAGGLHTDAAACLQERDYHVHVPAVYPMEEGREAVGVLLVDVHIPMQGRF